MATSFRILDLSSIPLKIVIESIGFMDLFNLTLCSKKSKKIICNTSKKEMKTDMFIDDEMISLKLKNAEHDILLVYEDYREQWRVEPFRLRKIGMFIFTSCAVPGGAANFVIAHLNEMFACQYIHIEYSSYDVSLRKCLKDVSSCESLNCAGSQLTNEDLKFILEKLKVSNFLKIAKYRDGEEPLNFRCDDAVFTTKTLVLENCSWVTSNNFLGSDCETMELKFCDLPVETYKLFVSRWMEGTHYQRLKWIRTLDNKSLRLEVLDREGAVWDPLHRGRYFMLDSKAAIDCSEELDIIRSDGTLATIVAKRIHFWMFVWHERFPELTKEHKIEKGHG